MESKKRERLKLLSLILISTLTVLIRNWGIIFLLFFMLIFMILSKKLVQKLFPRIIPLVYIAILIILFQLLFNTTTDIVSRLKLGLFFSLRLLILSILVFLYVQTTSVSALISALSFLPKTFQLILTITFSLIPIILEEAEKITLVQASRGYKKNWSIFPNIIPLIIPLLHRSLRRAENIAAVLSARGYHES